MNGPVDGGGGGLPSCKTTPSEGEVTGVTVSPAALVIVIVFSGARTVEEVPAGVVTVTARGPVAALEAALRLTVTCLPVGSIVGGLLMLMPSGGATPTALAFWKLSPRIVSVVAGAPVCRKFGVIDRSTGSGALTRNCAESGLENGTAAAPARTCTARIACGALEAIVALKVTEPPSALATGALRVTPSG